MQIPKFKSTAIVAAIRADVMPQVFDSVVCWDTDGDLITTGLLLGIQEHRYRVLVYFNEPQEFLWDCAVKIDDN